MASAWSGERVGLGAAALIRSRTSAHLRTPPLCPTPAEEINKRPDEYWTLVMDIARQTSLKRVMRCTQIMGRSESDDLSASQVFYPCMQAADIFFLKVCGAYISPSHLPLNPCMLQREVTTHRSHCTPPRTLPPPLPRCDPPPQADICQLGMDQRKVNMLAREYCDDCKPKRLKPVILSHHMMPGLLEVRVCSCVGRIPWMMKRKEECGKKLSPFNVQVTLRPLNALPLCHSTALPACRARRR